MEDKTALSVASITGGFVATIVTHPMDTIKTCMQGDVEQNKYTNIRGTN
jgi:solute carrier family 25 (mitochondrial carnitine/acylcarnitine transporter), member 20/29